ncbi:uncharacterized protein RHO25_011065 [Cercospora beticola]|uniref:Uncharacterized protein n=1 Tax=Cercospora beticola TaxID=122368 RepID=A0ABZ0P3H7_CERBT|nr:hypothetical protein RHO25_011065 [Cercospora beticola]CAK1366305.1 unnamed protein product [Cercospora beticola]
MPHTNQPVTRPNLAMSPLNLYNTHIGRSGHDQIYKTAIQDAVIRTCEAPISAGKETTALLDLQVELAAAELAGIAIGRLAAGTRSSTVGQEVFEDTLRLAQAANRRGSTWFIAKDVK